MIARFKLAIKAYSKSQFTPQQIIHTLKKKIDKIKIIPLLSKHIEILMVLITSLFLVELYFFFMYFREGAADSVS